MTRPLLDPDMIAAWRSTAERWQKLNPDNQDLCRACERVITLSDEVTELHSRLTEAREIIDEKSNLIQAMQEGDEDPVESESPEVKVSGTTNPDADTE